jgi:hypothetical protein
MYENLINQVIDKTKEEFADFPYSLNGEIYIGGTAEDGWRTQIVMSDEDKTKQEIQYKIYEYQNYLNKTDYKTFSDYEPKPNEVVADIIAQRKVARDYIRANQ